MKIRCNINGLDCPHCALKLEEKIKKTAGIKDASINFASGLLVVDTESEGDEEKMVSSLQEIIDSFEDGITVSIRD